MFKKIELSYTEATERKERLKRITGILSEGVYAYLKKNGLLRENSERTKRINCILEKAKEVGNQAEEEIEGENSCKTS